MTSVKYPSAEGKIYEHPYEAYFMKGPSDPEPEDLEGEDVPEDKCERPDFRKFMPHPGSFTIPLFDLHKQYKPMVDDLSRRFGDFLYFAQFVGGDPVDRFESAFAGYHDVKHCIGVGSGTDALFLALKSLDIGPGDEVIVPANTFIATAYAVSHTGARVKFCDVDPETYTIDPDKLEEALRISTRAVIPVHLYGHPCNMDEIKEVLKNSKIHVIEDCAQATGARWDGKRVGSFGDFGCFSFYPTKNLGGLAQGGAVITDSTNDWAMRVRSMGDMGRAPEDRSKYITRGYNSRLDTVNAMFLKECLSKLQVWNHQRQEIANWYEEELKNLGAVKTPYVHEKATHVYHLYMLQCLNKRERDGLREYLKKHKISTGLYYAKCLHQEEIYKFEGGNYFPVAEHLVDTLIALPMFPHLKRSEVEYVCKKIKEYFCLDS